MSDLSTGSRSERLDRALSALLTQTPEIEAAAVVSFDGLPMASALPAGMDEDRVAAMSAALLSLGERAAQGLGRGELSQVYIEGETGTVYLVSADDEAVLVAVAAQGAKVGLMLYEVRRTAAAVADALREEEAPDVATPVAPAPVYEPVLQAVPAPPSFPPAPAAPVLAAVPAQPAEPLQPAAEETPAPPAPPSYVSPLDAAWSSSSYAPSGSVLPPSAPGTNQHWS
jgi:predicted regulator of Ras-like GTPase activity (Roadblock/LC7/MglB family)